MKNSYILKTNNKTMTTNNIYLNDLSFNNTHISPTDFFSYIQVTFISPKEEKHNLKPRREHTTILMIQTQKQTRIHEFFTLTFISLCLSVENKQTVPRKMWNNVSRCGNI